MGTRPYATTNARIAKCVELLDELIGWADSDAQHADEHEATETAEDDRWRARALRRARMLVMECTR